MGNVDEDYILTLARVRLKLDARLATPEEDHGHQKGDVVINHDGKVHYFQVSRTPKSKDQREKLLKLGTIPIATHRFENIRYTNDELADAIQKHLK